MTVAIRIWVDADACPNLIKTVLFRVAQKRQLELLLIANQSIAAPPSRYIKSIRVSGGFDVADDYIVEHLRAGDVAITGDIPLAAKIIAKQGFVINPRGEAYTAENIGEKLAMRDFMEGLRDNGLAVGGAAAMTAKDVQNFANALDRLLVARQI
ncbi:YaiI/YqxD family protein [Methylomonas sp. 11b]|uniref:YaiI/YqxD family protein n=1 Tax=Methylomonas sp. 11b TaxID=1168169 RepID=UPI00047A3123|nr:YaiI/YqxD family protein [Methylomonas sp. 11b]